MIMTDKKERKPNKAQLEKKQAALEAKREALKAEQKEIAKEIIKPVKIVPLHQLNLMARVGTKKAKEQLGDKWV